MKSSKLFTFILIGLAVLLFIWLGIKNYPFGGQYEIEMVLGQDTSLITKLGPPPRVEMGDGYQKVFESPVYFDVRILPWYSKAQIFITYQDDGQVFDNMGIQMGSGFNYQVVEPMFLDITNDSYRQAVVEFNLDGTYQEKNFSRFLISTLPADLEVRGEMRIQSIKVVLKK